MALSTRLAKMRGSGGPALACTDGGESADCSEHAQLCRKGGEPVAYCETAKSKLLRGRGSGLRSRSSEVHFRRLA